MKDKFLNKYSEPDEIEVDILEALEEETIDEEIIEDVNDIAEIIVTGIVDNCKLLNVRETPDRNAKVTSLLSKGDKVTVIEGSNDEFYNIGIGYVMKDFVTLQ